MNSSILFIIFVSIIGILILYGIYLFFASRNLLKMYISSKNMLEIIPATYIDSKTNTETYLFITKNNDNMWTAGYRNGQIISLSFSDMSFPTVLQNILDEVTTT